MITHKKMKKILLMMLFVSMSILLAACSNNQKDTMIIQQSEFSEETQEVLKIVENEIAFFDYKVDETIKSIFIDIWTYKDGKWVNSGGTHGNINPSEKRIALRINKNAYDIFDMDDTGYTKYTYENVVDFSKSRAQADFRLAQPTSIEVDKEMALWVKLGSDKNSMAPNMSKNFREADCNAGVAVTITFSDKSID